MSSNGIKVEAKEETEHTADYAKLIEYGIDAKVAEELDAIYKKGNAYFCNHQSTGNQLHVYVEISFTTKIYSSILIKILLPSASQLSYQCTNCSMCIPQTRLDRIKLSTYQKTAFKQIVFLLIYKLYHACFDWFDLCCQENCNQ